MRNHVHGDQELFRMQGSDPVLRCSCAEILHYMKSSRKSSSRSWLLELCMLSAVCRSSYMCSFCHLSWARSSAIRASSFF